MLATIVDIVDTIMPIVMTHLLPKILQSLNPRRMVKPAQSIAKGAPTGVH